MVFHKEVELGGKLRIHADGVAVRSFLGFWINCSWKEVDEIELSSDRRVLTVRMLDPKPPTLFKTAKASAVNMHELVDKCMVFPEFTERYYAKRAA